MCLKNSTMLETSSLEKCTMSDFHDFGLTWKCQKIFPCGCTITSKTKIDVVWNFFYTPGILRAPSFQKMSNNIDFSLLGKQCICPAKMRAKLWKSHIVQSWCSLFKLRSLYLRHVCTLYLLVHSTSKSFLWSHCHNVVKHWY